jgi:hypothetical protein
MLEKYNMPCHAMQCNASYTRFILFWKVFHMFYNLICIFICTPICTKFYSRKKWVLQITSAHVGGHDANPTNTISPSLEFALSSLAAASDEQYKSISVDEIALLARKFCVMHKYRKERRINS